MANPLEQLDAFIGELLSSWSFSTTLIALGLAAFIAYPLFYWDDADTHPLLLARQAAPSPVRNRGESATYRSLEAPHGYPLKSGLNVKDAAAPKWSAGRDGDVRDIWRAVVRGGAGGEKGLIMTVVGKDAPVEEHVGEMSKQINIIGHHLQTSAGKRVAIYLPNSVEYLSTVFGMPSIPLWWRKSSFDTTQHVPSMASHPSSSLSISPTTLCSSFSTTPKPTAWSPLLDLCPLLTFAKECPVSSRLRGSWRRAVDTWIGMARPTKLKAKLPCPCGTTLSARTTGRLARSCQKTTMLYYPAIWSLCGRLNMLALLTLSNSHKGLVSRVSQTAAQSHAR